MTQIKMLRNMCSRKSWAMKDGSFALLATKSFSVQSALRSRIDKVLLTSLRKKTGYPFAKCNEALKCNENDMEKATTWLHEQAEKEGWMKAQKLKQRETNQGLVGILKKDNFVSLVELACETDFVSRNELFQELVATTARSTLEFRKKVILQNQSVNSFFIDEIAHLREQLMVYDLQALKVAGSDMTIEKYVVDLVGKIGENIKLKSALSIATSEENVIGAAVHGTTTSEIDGCMMGTYAATVVLKPLSKMVDRADLGKLADSLSQHVIGLNPLSIDVNSDVSTDEAFLTQDFLLNDKLKVSQILDEAKVKCVDFLRFAVNQ